MAVDRSRLPPLAGIPHFAFPHIERRILETGLRVWTIEHRAVPLISVLVLVRRGAAADPEGCEGLAAIVGDLLDEGAGALDALGLHEALGRIGAQLDTEVGSDATLLTLTVLSRFADRGVGLLGSMIAEPRLDVRDFERVRDLRLNRLVQIRDMPPALADRAFTELIYPHHPYGHLSIGTERALGRLTLNDVRTFHAEGFVPANTTVIAAGDGTHDELAALVARGLAGWTVAGGAPAEVLPAAGPADDKARPAAQGRCETVGTAAGPHGRQPFASGLSDAARPEHGARRTVREPHQHEPA
jgi:predicted Zn-dependent peptidase